MIDGIDDSMAPALAHAETPAGTPVVGIIGGSGLLQLAGLTDVQRRVMRTPWGQPSGALSFGRLAGVPVVFLARHGYGHTIAPHDINYRANIWALREAGASSLIACSAVGGIREDLVPGALVTPDQIIDYTWGRAVSYFTGEDQPVVHVDVSYPYDEPLRQRLMTAADTVGQPLARTGCYGCTQGPRLETLAEVRRYQRDGCDMLGMTAMPEAALARELGLSYAMLAIVANRAGELSAVGQPLTAGARGQARDPAAQVSAVLTEAMPGLLRVLAQTVTALA
ncbi:MAG: S-methyl-5'-thioinosine phosphorylase [Lautropia sp.]|nr:S-methyl-5'-thioinosine phosphorylase [Lautropia sp.]